MSILGLGACPCGSTPAGVGQIPPANSSTARLLKKVDGSQGDCAKINTVSGDYVLDSAGNKVGDDSLNQMVYLALRTQLGSSAVQAMGIDLPKGVITDNISSRVKLAVAAALKNLTDARLISLVSVTTTRMGTSGVRIQIDWKALSTGQVRSTFI